MTWWRAMVLVLVFQACWAQVVPWRQNEPIEVAVEASVANRDHRPRLLYFPSPEIGFTQDWSSDDLQVTLVGNGVQIMLRNPGFQTTVHVLGSDGAVYPLMVRRADAQEQVSPVLQVVPAKVPAADAGPAAGSSGGGLDLDGEALAMMRHMIGGERHHWVTDAPDGEVVDGQFQVGRRIYESDHLSIHSTRMYRGLRTVGYQCVLHYRGSDPVRLNMQRLYFPGAISVHVSKQVLMDPKQPSTALAPGDRLILWFVARARE